MATKYIKAQTSRRDTTMLQYKNHIVMKIQADKRIMISHCIVLTILYKYLTYIEGARDLKLNISLATCQIEIFDLLI